MLERLQKEMIKALKEGNKFRKLTLSTLISAVKKAGIDAGCRENIPDEMVIQVLKKEKKNLVDTIEKFPDMPVEKKNEYINQALIIDEFVPLEICDEKQIEDIKKIERLRGLDSLSAKLKEVALARLEHPELGIEELGRILSPPLSKSGVNNRLRRIGEIAKGL